MAENETETSSSTSSISNICVPRYARVNTLKTTTESVHDTLKHQGWLLQHWTKQPVKWKRFRKLISAMQPNWYYADCHIDDLLVFPVGTDLHKNKLVRDGCLILQDKASCLPIICLQPSRGSDVVDTCAAPGIKSFHLASVLDDSGNIYSFDREKRRIHTMQQLLRNVGASCVHVHNEDFLRVDVRKDKRLAKVEYALVDPPCSGSGIVSRQNSGADTEQQQSRCADPKRLKSLANFQAMLLKHTFNIRRLQRLVYSTCSTSAEENEMVIQEILSDSNITNNFQLITAPVPEWTLRGLPEYDFSEKVLRADPQKTLTNGFFVAVFERI